MNSRVVDGFWLPWPGVFELVLKVFVQENPLMRGTYRTITLRMLAICILTELERPSLSPFSLDEHFFIEYISCLLPLGSVGAPGVRIVFLPFLISPEFSTLAGP